MVFRKRNYTDFIPVGILDIPKFAANKNIFVKIKSSIHKYFAEQTRMPVAFFDSIKKSGWYNLKALMCVVLRTVSFSLYEGIL